MLTYLVINNSCFTDIFIHMIYPTWNVRFTIYIWSNNIFNRNMIKTADIYVRITVSVLQIIHICWGKKNSQYYMLDSPEYKEILSWQLLLRIIVEIYFISMCIYHQFIHSSISWINFQHSMLSSKNKITISLKKKYQSILSTTMLGSLVIHNSSVPDV